MIDADVGSSPFNRPAPRLRDPDTDDLDRLAASLHYLMLFGREPSPDEASDHVGHRADFLRAVLERGAVPG